MRGITSPLGTGFLEAIRQVKAELGNPEVLWYRGHPNAPLQRKWDTLPEVKLHI
jgi:hypothetical protein